MIALRLIVLCALAVAFHALPSLPQDGKERKEAPIEVLVSDADFQELHEKLLAEDSFQFERPVEEVEDVVTRESSFSMPQWLSAFFKALGPILKIIFYVGAGVLAAYIIYFILSAAGYIDLKDLRKKKALKAEEDAIVTPDLRPDAVAARGLLEEADLLAREGKFAEAVHLLLFRSIEDIQARRNRRLSTALTAREIGSMDDLPAKPRSALAPIIQLVERSFFGGRPVDEDGWKTARTAYENFAFGEAWT